VTALLDAPADPRRYVMRAHRHAAECTRAWLLAEGLYGQIDDLRFGDGRLIMAPVLHALRGAAELGSREACDAADRAAGLVSAWETADDDREALAASCAAAVLAAERACRRTQRTLRDLAQLAMGVGSLRHDSDVGQRLDRAAVAVLHPPAGEGHPVGLCRDGVRLRATTWDELAVEVGGLLCRLLIDRRTVVRLEFADTAIDCRVDAQDTLHIELLGAADAPPCLLTELGWESRWAAWRSPVAIAQPAALVVDSLRRAAMAPSTWTCVGPRRR
jgi:hypothetical protein